MKEHFPEALKECIEKKPPGSNDFRSYINNNKERYLEK